MSDDEITDNGLFKIRKGYPERNLLNYLSLTLLWKLLKFNIILFK